MLRTELPKQIMVSADTNMPLSIAITQYCDFESQIKASLTAREYECYLWFVRYLTTAQINEQNKFDSE